MGFAKSFTESFNQSYGIAAKTRAAREESEYEWSMKSALARGEERSKAEAREKKAQADAQSIAEQTGKPVKDVYERLVNGSDPSVVLDWAKNTIGGPSASPSRPQSIDEEMAGNGIAAAESPVDRLLKEDGATGEPVPSKAATVQGSDVNMPTSGGYRPKPKVLSPEEQRQSLIREYGLASTSPERKSEIESQLRAEGQAKDFVDPPTQVAGRTKVDLAAQIATEKDPQKKMELQSALDSINQQDADQGKLTAGAVRGVAVIDGELQPAMIEARRQGDKVSYFLAGTNTPAEGARASDDQEVREAADLAKMGERPEVQKQNERVVSLTSGLRSSARLQAIVDKDEGVLVPVTGTVVDVLDSARKEFAAATSLLGVELDKNGNGEVSGDTMKALQKKVDSIDLGAVTDRAELRDLFNAEMGLLAYRMGAAEGQSGNAFSEKDFNRIAAGLRGSTSAEGFKKSLNGYMSGQLRSVSDAATIMQETNGQIERFKNQYGYNPVGVFPSPEAFIADRAVDANGDIVDQELMLGYQAAKAAKPLNGLGETQGSGTPNDPVRNKPNAVTGKTSSGISWSIE